MGKLSAATRTQTGPQGPLTTEQTSSVTTYNGAVGYAFDTKSELFLLAVQNFVGEDTFYEKAENRDSRYVDLVRQVAVQDPVWTADFLKWLRTGANMRTTSIVGAIEAARTVSLGLLRKPGEPGYIVHTADVPMPRQILNAVLARPDEPAEALGYWLSLYGRKLPKWLKRSLADAARRLYTPSNVLKYDSDRNPIRMADVVEFSQAKRNDPATDAIFTYLLDERHGRGNPNEIDMFRERHAFNHIPIEARRGLLTDPNFHNTLRKAGLTWEAITGWLQGSMDAQAWEVSIPHMRYGALIKNLANFEKAGIGKDTIEYVRRVLADPDNVRQSRLLPMAILNAYNNVPGDTFKAALDEAATASLGNIGSFGGRTLVLIDTSGSMGERFTTHRGRTQPGAEALMRWDAAALFGIAFAGACQHADVVSFSAPGFSARFHGNRFNRYPHSGYLPFPLRQGENVLSAVARFRKEYFINGGTATEHAVRNTYSNHDRVLVLTDEQANPHSFDSVYRAVPATVPVYTFNLAGYAQGHAPTGRNRYLVGGLSDAAFKMITALEDRRSGRWPWQTD